MGKEKKVNNMTIEKRSEAYVKSIGNYPEEIINMVKKAYVQGAKDQRKLDIDEGCEWILNNFVPHFYLKKKKERFCNLPKPQANPLFY